MNNLPNESPLFDNFHLNRDILRGIYSKQYSKPTQFQKEIITNLLSSKNILVHMPPVTGKTTSYIISSLQWIDTSKPKDIQCLILTATRDIAVSIGNLYKSIANYTSTKIHVFIGGTSIKADIAKLSNGCNIVIGTPGRVLDMINKKILKLNDIKLFIIDDVNEVIKRGFIVNIKTIYSYINPDVPTAGSAPTRCVKALFTASSVINDEIIDILDMKQAQTITKWTGDSNGIEYLRQYKISLKEEWKLDVLLNWYKWMEIEQVIIYCNDMKRCELWNDEWNKRGFICSYIREDKEKVISNYKNGYIRQIIATNATPSKEIEVYLSSLIINYDLPSTVDECIERVYRPEAFGKKGTVITFLKEDDKDVFSEYEKKVNRGSIEELPIELSILDSSGGVTASVK